MRLTWVSVKPVWWPANIPYQSVSAAPHGWEGNQEDPEDTNERHRLPEELVPQSLSPNSPAARLMADPRKQFRNNEDSDKEEEAFDFTSAVTSTPCRQPKRRAYDPYSQDPTPLALRHQRRKL